MHEGLDLMKLSGSAPSKFALKISEKIFTDQELIEGMISPQKKASRKALPGEKIDILKSGLKFSL